MRPCRLVPVAAQLLLVAAATPQAAPKHTRESIACPASILVSETATATSPFAVLPNQTTHRLSTASVSNVIDRREYELKPDEEHERKKQTVLTWNLDAYSDHDLYLRCIYHDTHVKLSVQLPRALHHCTSALTLDQKAQIIGSTTVECH